MSITKKNVVNKKNKHITMRHTQHTKHSKNTINNQYMKNTVKININKYIKVYKLIQKFKLFYKSLSYNELFVIKNYNDNGYQYIHPYINSFLYNNNKITKLTFEKYIFDKDNIYLLKKKYFTKYINYKTQNFKNNSKFVSFYMNDVIINSINTIDTLFNNEYINTLKGDEILYIGDDGDIINNNNIHIGEDVVFKNFISSSIDKEIYVNLISGIPYPYHNNNNNNVCCLYMLYKLQSIPYIYIPMGSIGRKIINNKLEISNYFEKFEYLLPRNLKFKLINITYENKVILQPKKKLKFKQLNTLTKKINIKHLENNNLDNHDYNIISHKIYRTHNIKIYHLEFIEQLPITKIEPYVYNNDIEIVLLSK